MIMNPRDYIDERWRIVTTAQGRRKGFCIGTAKRRRGVRGPPPEKFWNLQLLNHPNFNSFSSMLTISKLAVIWLLVRFTSFYFFFMMNVIMDACLWKDVTTDMIVAPLLRWKCIKTAAKDDPSRPLDKGTVPELVDIQLIPPPFFQCSGSSMTNKPRSTSLAKTTSNLPMRQTSFFFFFSENIGTAAAGPAGPAPAPLLQLTTMVWLLLQTMAVLTQSTSTLDKSTHAERFS